MKKIVVALGGNALGNSPFEQLQIVKKTASSLVDLIENGNEVIITHGNGPQVGMIYNDMALENPNSTEDDMPFPECGAMSQGYIGYHLQQAIEAEFEKRNINKNVITVVSQVLVDKDDDAFNNPSKPVGVFYTKEEAEELAKESGFTYKEDAGRGYRRVVASPKPLEICELDTIKNLIDSGCVVIACGGGGVPVIKKEFGYEGIPAVIDKDRTSALLASKLGADTLLILTAVPNVKIHFNREDEQDLTLIDDITIKKYMDDGEFARGSMLPKVEAALYFLHNSENTKAIITSLENAKDAISGNVGTTIVRK